MSADAALTLMSQALGVSGRVKWAGEGALTSAYGVSDVIAASVGAVGLAAARLTGGAEVWVNRARASHWCASSVQPLGWRIPDPWDPIAGVYACRDGWIRLHTNAPLHKTAALTVLGCPAEADAVRAATAAWTKDELEAAIITAGGAAAAMRSRSEWLAHPQGKAVSGEPLVAFDRHRTASKRWQAADPAAPLAGLKVLDLTRVLAGPVATRTLAGLGATVLRIDPPEWDEPGVLPDVTCGKARARLNLKDPASRALFEKLLQGADLLVHGYRPGALARLGFDTSIRTDLNPALREVTLCAYGWSGPWSGRRGFDSLVQMSNGFAHKGMTSAGATAPVSLPVQALDHVTGYLMAAAALVLLGREDLFRARLSLARTGETIAAFGPCTGPKLDCPNSGDYDDEPEPTDWGPALRLRTPVRIGMTGLHWSRPAGRLGSDAPMWPQ